MTSATPGRVAGAPRTFLTIGVAEGIFREQERMGSGWSRIDLIGGIGQLLRESREAPHFAVAEVDYDLSVDLATAVGGAKHGDARLDVKRVRLSTLGADEGRRKQRSERNHSEQHGNHGQQRLEEPIHLHHRLLRGSDDSPGTAVSLQVRIAG